jgi:hypothetical protein
MRVELRSANVSQFHHASESGEHGTHATVSPSTMTLICHMTRSPRPDMVSDPTCIGRVHECREMLNGLPSMTPGTKQVSNGFRVGTMDKCQSSLFEFAWPSRTPSELDIPLPLVDPPPPPSCTA